MIYAHLTNGTVDQVGTPPATAYAESRWWDLRTLDPASLTQAGWVEVTENPRPADTATTTSDMTWTLTGGKAVQTWTVRAKTAGELDADIAATNNTTIREQARTALTGNRTFLAVAAPTNAQVGAQVKALTRQMNGLIRLTLGELDGTD